MPLSPDEQQLLAAIENDLSEQDPRLARTMTRTGSPSAGRFPLRRQHLATLGAALLTLILVHSSGADIHPAASAALTCGLLTTWLISAARGSTRPAAATRPDDGGAPPAGPPRVTSK
jgi:Protein of unknown function (DUF3040)